MKFLKFCSLFFLLILSTGLICIKDNNTPLSQEELKYIFPDDNFRRVVCYYFPNEEITLSKLNKLDGEFYASNENIKSIKGISKLKNIDSFVFWNNHIKYIPSDIQELNKVKSINIANNYLTEKDIIEKLINRGVEINYDLNFINNEKYQYKLSCKTSTLYLNKNEKINLRSFLSKSINNYPKYWEVSNEFSSMCDLYIQSNNPENISVQNKGICTAGNISGEYYITISLNEKKLPKSTVTIKIIII